MCHPIAMLGLQVASTVAGGMSSQSEYKYQAKLARIQGEHQFKAAVANAEFAHYAAERGAATQRVKMFNAGTAPGSASAVEVLAEDRGNRSIDEMNEYYKGRLALWESEREAQALKRKGKQALYKSLISAGGTIIGGGIDNGWWGRGGTPKSTFGSDTYIWDQRSNPKPSTNS